MLQCSAIYIYIYKVKGKTSQSFQVNSIIDILVSPECSYSVDSKRELLIWILMWISTAWEHFSVRGKKKRLYSLLTLKPAVVNSWKRPFVYIMSQHVKDMQLQSPCCRQPLSSHRKNVCLFDKKQATQTLWESFKYVKIYSEQVLCKFWHGEQDLMSMSFLLHVFNGHHCWWFKFLFSSLEMLSELRGSLTVVRIARHNLVLSEIVAPRATLMSVKCVRTLLVDWFDMTSVVRLGLLLL